MILILLGFAAFVVFCRRRAVRPEDFASSGRRSGRGIPPSGAFRSGRSFSCFKTAPRPSSLSKASPHRDGGGASVDPRVRDRTARAFEAEFGLLPGEWESGLSGSILSSYGLVESNPFGAVACPRCGRTFPAGVPYCEDCGDPTLDSDDLVPVSEHDKIDRLTADLVCVFSTTDYVEARIVQSLLESHDIPTTTNGPIALNVYAFQRIDAALIRLMVLEPDAEQARLIIQSAQ